MHMAISMRQDDKLQEIEKRPNYWVTRECQACSNYTTLSCPCLAASEGGVSPDLLGLSGLTSFRSNSRLTVLSWLFPAAHGRGVRPGLLELLGGDIFPFQE